MEAGLWIYCYLDDCVVWAEQPSVYTDDRQRLHNAAGPAFVAGDWLEYFWHGVLVTEQIVMCPETLSAQMALAETNAEVRRVIIDRIGSERFTREANAQQIAVDGWGKLWCIDLPSDEPYVFVEIINSTPEPDGSWKTYRLRVPPGMSTPREAVLWTHDLPATAEPIYMT